MDENPDAERHDCVVFERGVYRVLLVPALHRIGAQALMATRRLVAQDIRLGEVERKEGLISHIMRGGSFS